MTNATSTTSNALSTTRGASVDCVSAFLLIMIMNRTMAAKGSYLPSYGGLTVSPAMLNPFSPLCYPRSTLRRTGRAVSGTQGLPRRATALNCKSSLRMTATTETLPGLPR